MKTLAVLALLVTPTPTYYAPVYAYVSDNVLARVGTFAHKPNEGYSVLYCIRQKTTAVELNCVVRTPADKLVLISVMATEHRT